jgi:endonuclease-8
LPEGDSIRGIAYGLRLLVGDRLEAESPSPRGRATGVARAVDGRRLEAVDAIGKNLVLRFEGGVVVRSHLRLNGRWRVERREAARVYRGKPWLVLRGTEWEATQWNGPVLSLDGRPVQDLGPDLIADGTDPDVLVARLRRIDQSRLLGDALVDQRVVAGIGNMWLAEALWHALLSPWSTLADVDDESLAVALCWARDAMRASVTGQRPRRAVYRRAGRGCRRCGEPVHAGPLGEANRTAYWCPSCQPDREGGGGGGI